ncbi:hypothetical protein [Pectobacterium polaris]|uniref:hypothetical protein n=1 Tax=Pectobacterium polaris TaxID=2042057 RepID=UPI002404C34C|nr:hypothetical protein [Pectobacterium polaris]MDG0802926.1 hypothetical protein [Pectobacterium polaris]
MGLNRNNRWEVENDFLRQLLTYNDGDKVRVIPELKACWSAGSGFSIVKGVLTWLTMRALNIERLPWMSDWPFTFVHRNKKALQGVLSYMEKHPQEVDNACNELKDIYNHTQSFYSEKETLRLGRGYKNLDDEYSGFDEYGNYAKTVYIHAKASEFLGSKYIEVPHDVITSWGYSSGYAKCIVGVEMNIPVKDILCSYETISPCECEIQHSAIESGEFLVLNRNWNGMIEIPVNEVKIVDGFNIEVPDNKKCALKALSTKIPSCRPYTNYNVTGIHERKSKQPFKSRASRAWKILKNKYQ